MVQSTVTEESDTVKGPDTWDWQIKKLVETQGHEFNSKFGVGVCVA